MYRKIAPLMVLSLLCPLYSQRKQASPRLALGLANIQTVKVGTGASHITPSVVVRIIGRNNKVQSFGMSNEAGILVMPLPQGEYCYEAFTEKGEPLQMERKAEDRCFAVNDGEDVTVGVGFK